MADLTTTTSTQMPGFVQPYAQGYLQRAQQVADSPYQAYQGQRVADFTPYQTQGYGGIYSRAMQGSPVMGAANQQLQSTIQGNYLNGNPYLQSQIDAAQGDLVKQWNTVQKPQWDTAMQRSGSFGNSGVAEMNGYAQDALQKNLGQVSSNMRFANYNAERANQMNAMGMAPGFANNDYLDLDRIVQAGGAIQGQNQRYMDDAYSRFAESRAYPTQQLGVMGNALGGVNFGRTTTESQPGPSTASQLVGGAITGSQLYDMLFRNP